MADLNYPEIHREGLKELNELEVTLMLHHERYYTPCESE